MGLSNTGHLTRLKSAGNILKYFVNDTARGPKIYFEFPHFQIAHLFISQYKTSTSLIKILFTDDLINSVRGLQQFAAARAGGSFLGTGDARQEEASLDLLVPNSSQVIPFKLYCPSPFTDAVTELQCVFCVFILVLVNQSTFVLLYALQSRNMVSNKRIAKELNDEYFYSSDHDVLISNVNEDFHAY